MSDPPLKRRRLSEAAEEPANNQESHQTLASLGHPISPPRKRKLQRDRQLISSPFKLTTIKDLPGESNVGAISLHDLLGDPLIAECWDFNYLHDIDFLLQHFDVDTRASVKVHVVHGFWKNEDSSRLFLQEQASKHGNVALHTAYMPEMYGTHHSKMLVLLRHDDFAQVIIHTANMIAKDWTNMTNGVWRSPLLPLLKSSPDKGQRNAELGTGHRFKADLLAYLAAYNTRRSVCTPLVQELAKYDFGDVRGVLIASVPGRHDLKDDPIQPRWGWAAVKQALRGIPVQDGKSVVVAQISSIATLGATDAWLQRTLLDSFALPTKPGLPKPTFKIIFPTPDEIRRSLDGYASGASIHMKIQSNQQAKQLQYMKPLFCHWSNDTEQGVSQEGESHDAGRKRAAPHIKTYIRYGEKSIDWAILTSANISKQAWGEAANNGGEMRISSWEIGVLVWPELLAKGSQMVGTFKTDEPSKEALDGEGPLIGLRIPYNLPLQRYGKSEVPWVATADYTEKDWTGRTWQG